MRKSKTVAFVCEGSKVGVQESRQPGVGAIGGGRGGGGGGRGEEVILWMSSVIVTALQSVWLP